MCANPLDEAILVGIGSVTVNPSLSTSRVVLKTVLQSSLRFECTETVCLHIALYLFTGVLFVDQVTVQWCICQLACFQVSSLRHCGVSSDSENVC